MASCLLAFARPAPAADAGIPMLVFAWPIMWVVLIPVILIEWVYLRRRCADSSRRVLKHVAVANLVSTALGIPLTWIILVFAELTAQSALGKLHADGLAQKVLGIASAPLQAAWLMPFEQSLYWMIPTAEAILLIPFFFASWWLEGFWLSRTLDAHPKQLFRDAGRANLLSYCLLMAMCLGWLFWNLKTHSFHPQKM